MPREGSRRRFVPEASFALLALHVRPATRLGRSSFAAPEDGGRRRRIGEVPAVSPTRWARTRASGPRASPVFPRETEPAHHPAASRRMQRRQSAAPSGAASSRRSRASLLSEDRLLASHRWSNPSEVTSRRPPRHLTAPLPPHESDRPRADLLRHPRHRRRISGAGFVLPHRLRRSRPSLLHGSVRIRAGLPAGCLPPPVRSGPEPLSHPSPARRRKPADRRGQRLCDLRGSRRP